MLSRDHRCKNLFLKSTFATASWWPPLLSMTLQNTDDDDNDNDNDNDDDDRWDTWTKAGLNKQQLVQFVHR